MNGNSLILNACADCCDLCQMFMKKHPTLSLVLSGFTYCPCINTPDDPINKSISTADMPDPNGAYTLPLISFDGIYATYQWNFLTDFKTDQYYSHDCADVAGSYTSSASVFVQINCFTKEIDVSIACLGITCVFSGIGTLTSGAIAPIVNYSLNPACGPNGHGGTTGYGNGGVVTLS